MQPTTRILRTMSLALLTSLLPAMNASRPHAQSGGLFTDAPGTQRFARENEPWVLRARPVTVDLARLRASADLGIRRVAQPPLQLDLFDDVTLTAELDRVDPAPGGYTWVGHLAGVPMSTVTLATVGSVVAGSIAHPAGTFEIRHVGGGIHEIREIDQSAYPPEMDPIPVTAPMGGGPLAAAGDTAGPPAGSASIGAVASAPDDGSLIDVMVLYTPAAVAEAGGEAGMAARINLGISETNTSYANSGITQRLRLVHSQQVTYTENNNLTTDLTNLSNYNGSFISTELGNLAASLRDTHKADLVTLLTAPASPEGCGVAWLMTTVSESFAPYGFNVVWQTCISPNYSFAHELGHNMGARHDWFVDSNVTPHTYAHGYVSTALPTRFRTVMAYNNLCSTQGFSCTRVLYWSNPNVSMSFQPMGIAGGTRSDCPVGDVANTACDADDHRTLNETAATVANFRQGGVSCTYTVAPLSANVPASASTNTLSVTTPDGCPWTAAANSSFLNVTAGTDSTGSGTVTYTVAPNVGRVRTGTLTVAGQTVTITQATSQPTLTLSPARLEFGAVMNGTTIVSVTPPQTVTVQQSGGTAVAWTVTANVPWVTITAADASGRGTGQFTVSLNNTSGGITAPSTQTGTITVRAPDAQTDPDMVVRLVAYQPGSSIPPFGQVDTPAQNAGGVQGAIPVTGWVLDDVGVTDVKIYRNCLGFENQAACQVVGGNNLVYVGTAAFLPGARPDVEAAFSTRPEAYRAGWGYLALSNLLPHVTGSQPYGGQGPMTLYAYATDREGQLTLLGRTYVENPPQPTTIAMNNDAIAKPFGAIDTPGQGVIVSGLLPNFGWALTPDTDTVAGNDPHADATDILIPTTGSTMFVFLDGVATAAIPYNHCRGSVGTPPPPGVYCNDDISQIFGNPTPQPPPPPFTTRTANQTRYRNLDAGRGAIGAYNIDTTAMTNGLHTIVWSVTDSAGRTEGIGSRFFQVLNAGADAVRDPGSGIRPFDALALAQAALSPAEGRDPGAAPQEREGADGGGSGGSATPATVGRVRRTRPVSAGSASRPYRTEQRITDEVRARVGFDLGAPFVPLTPDAEGVYHVRLGDLDRLELDLGPVMDGYLDHHSRSDFPMGPREITPGVIVRRALPIGATLDTEAGIFAWAPPPGYLGTYRLAFGRARSPNAPDVGVAPVPGSRIPSPDHADIVVDVTIAPREAPAPGKAVIRMHLDAPAEGATLSGPFTVAGWALDPQAGLGAGVGAVHVWAQRTDVAGVPPVFLGAAALGVARPDVAAAHGPQFATAGFALTGIAGSPFDSLGSLRAREDPASMTLLPGAYTLTAYVWNTRTARWEDARSVHVFVK